MSHIEIWKLGQPVLAVVMGESSYWPLVYWWIFCASCSFLLQYAKSKNCQMELRFATSILKLPMVVVIVGTGYGWEATEVACLF